MKPSASPPPIRGGRRYRSLPLSVALAVLPVVAALLTAPIAPIQAAEADIAAERSELDRQLATAVGQLATWCDGEQLARQARETRQLIETRNPLLLYTPKLPDEVRSPPPADSPAPVLEWDRKYTELCGTFSERYFDLAKTALRERQPSLAYDLVLETARVNPDHKRARELLGYQFFRDRWRTPFEVKQLNAGMVWDDEFGWIREAHLPRYRAGQRFFRGRWVTAEQEAAVRSNIMHGWEIETEHYKVTTNHSLQEGVALGRRLEELYRVWQHVFVRFYASPTDISQLFEGKARSSRSSTYRHEVVYYRNREEYNRSLRHSISADIGITYGIYLGDEMKAYFFAGDDQDPTTLIHEATHQLFSEVKPKVRAIGRRGNFWLRKRANFWIVEGIACYMESLDSTGTAFTLGGFEKDLLKSARYRYIKDEYYVPLADLTRYSMQRLQQDPDIAKIYSQSTGVTSFLMHHDNGRYREALIRYMLAVYTGTDDANTLSEVTETSYEELDRRYGEYLRTGK